MTSALPSFPVDDETLCLLDQAIDGSPERSSVTDLLAVLSGYNPAVLVQVADGVTEYPDPTYHPNDVIRALVNEVRRLRAAKATDA